MAASEHDWKPQSLYKPTFCELCVKLIKGISNQALRCTRCQRTCHPDCAKQAIHCQLPLTGEHSFHTKSFRRPTYCNACRCLMHGVAKQGVQCEICRYAAHGSCRDQGAVSDCCRSFCQDSPDPQHQWIEGNVHATEAPAACLVCDEALSMTVCLADYHCAWCSALCHAKCLERVPPICNLGSLRAARVPPTAIDNQGRIHLDRLDQVVPLVCFVNSKSGGGQGSAVLRKLQRHLHPAQVFDLADGEPRAGLEAFRGPSASTDCRAFWLPTCPRTQRAPTSGAAPSRVRRWTTA